MPLGLSLETGAEPANPVAYQETTTGAGATGHGRIEPLPRVDPGSDWIILPLLLSLVLITISRAAYRRRFRHIFLSLFSSNNLNIMQREGNILSEPVSVLLFANFLLMVSLFLFLLPGVLPSVTTPGLPPYLWYPLLLVALILFIFLKVIGVVLSGNVFRTDGESASYLLNIFLFNHVIGILLWPLMVYVIYSGSLPVLKATAILLIGLYLARGVKGLVIGLTRSRFSPVLFLLYLCTLEIIPLLLVVKLAGQYT